MEHNFQVCEINNGHCNKCKRNNAKVQHYNFVYCYSCFNKIMEARIRKGVFRKKISKIDDIAVMGELASLYMSKIMPHVKFTKINDVDLLSGEIVVNNELLIIPWSVDHTILKFSDLLFTGNIEDFKMFNDNIIPLFMYCTEEELVFLAKTKEIEYKKIDSKLSKHFNDLNKRFSSIKATYMKNILKLKDIM